MALNAGSPSYDIARGNRADFDLTPDEDGYLRFTFTAPEEGEYRVRIYKKNGESYDRLVNDLSFYALENDLAARVPLRGDFQMHTCRSDGRRRPRHGMRELQTSWIRLHRDNGSPPLLSLPRGAGDIRQGSVHAYHNPGRRSAYAAYSDAYRTRRRKLFVNGLLESSPNNEKGTDAKYRSTDGNAPDSSRKKNTCRQ